MRARVAAGSVRNGGGGSGFAELGEALAAARGAGGECLSSARSALSCSALLPASGKGKGSGCGAGAEKPLREGGGPAGRGDPSVTRPFPRPRRGARLAPSSLVLSRGLVRVAAGDPYPLSPPWPWRGSGRRERGAAAGLRERGSQDRVGPCGTSAGSTPTGSFCFLLSGAEPSLLVVSWGGLLGSDWLWVGPGRSSWLGKGAP